MTNEKLVGFVFTNEKIVDNVKLSVRVTEYGGNCWTVELWEVMDRPGDVCHGQRTRCWSNRTVYGDRSAAEARVAEIVAGAAALGLELVGTEWVRA